MKVLNNTAFLLGIVLVAFISQTLGHSYVTSPTSRSNQRESTTGCRGPNCLGPCDRKVAGITRSPIATKRGDSITIQWPRNNHAGGFIRFAWAPTSESDSHAAFDNGVQQINCHEVGGCSPDSASNPNGGDSGPADGSSRACSTTLKVPSHLTDGKWTLQWAWFGGAFALGDYYSCVDYQVTGGSAVSSQVAAVFKGGDYTYPGQNKCKFFNTDRLHRCVNEPCDNPVYSLNAERSGPAYQVASANPTPAPTPSPTPSTPVTTGRPSSTSTTGRSTSTTGRPSSSSSSSTTGIAETPSSATCTLGQQRCSGSSQFQTCGWASRTQTGWSVVQNCPSGLQCHQVQGNYIWCY